jgi:hypothetical protein
MTIAAHGCGGDCGEIPDRDFTCDPATHPRQLAAARRHCTRCALMPVMEPGRGLCGACLGRELLGYASRDEQTAAVKAAWEAGRR